MKRLSVLLIVFAMSSTASAAAFMEITVNGMPYTGQDVEASDIVGLILIDDGFPPQNTSGYIDVSHGGNGPHMWGPCMTGSWDFTPVGDGYTSSGSAFFNPQGPLCDDFIFVHEFHVPDGLEASDNINISYYIIYGAQVISDNPILHVFSDPTLRLVSPNGGESLLAGSTHTVSWEDSRDGGSCSGGYVVNYSTDGGQSWNINFALVVGICELEWTVPSVVSDQVVVRVCDSADSSFCDISDGPFSISRCGDELSGDLNDDCYVNGYDYALFALEYDDGLAGISELAELADSWLSCGDSSNPLCLD
jgi:hypothetical protein